jgi:hypothetical protein
MTPERTGSGDAGSYQVAKVRLVRRRRRVRQPCALWRVRESQKPNQSTESEAEGSEQSKAESPTPFPPAVVGKDASAHWVTGDELPEIRGGVKRYSQSHKSREEHRRACGSPLPPNDEEGSPDDRRKQHQPAVSSLATIIGQASGGQVSKIEPRA